MTLSNISNQIKKYLLILALPLIVAACKDDSFISEKDYTIAGKEVTVTIPISIPEMTVQTRASINDEQLSAVNSLWVAVFSSDTGEITSFKKKNGTEKGWYIVKDPSNNGFHQIHDLDLKALSGPSYIVAVANVENLGVSSESPDAEPVAISTLLESATTWQEFLKIAAVTPNDLDGAYNPTNDFQYMTMSGCYISEAVGGTHPEDWEDQDFMSISIPSTDSGYVTLEDGAIHLRRLMSHITFNVSATKPTPAEGETAPENPVVDVNVLSYRIVNLPAKSWLYERGTGSDGATPNMQNFGDIAKTANEAKKYYSTVTYTSQYIKEVNSNTENKENNEEKNKVQTFDFWQSENKHTGTIPENVENPYNLREKKNENGLYTYLCGDTWSQNNMASYVVITCEVKYIDKLNVNSEGEEEPEGTEGSSPVYRTGVAEYAVHLGYINKVANDFNCYRNCNYTYDIKVAGLNDIRVEAYNQGDRNAAEGVVTDVENPTIMLDAHYACFNIMLTDEELNKSFGYIVTTYRGDDSYTYYDSYYDPTSKQQIPGNDATAESELIDWVEIKRTTDMSTLAEYKPRTAAQKDDEVWTIKEFAEKVKNIGGEGGLTNIKKENYFTVFINEYTYEPRYGEENYGNESDKQRWKEYVNRNPRRFYLRVTKRVSEDKNSIYVRSKYSAMQQSIQTYYSLTNPTDAETVTENGKTYTTVAGSAVGVERENETEGINMRDTYGGGSDQTNGRWNVAQYLCGVNRSATELGINDDNENRHPLWATFVTLDKSMTRGAVTGQRAQNGPDLPAREITKETYNPLYLPALVLKKGTSMFNDPQAANEAIEAINACTSRNRDNNGNGRIDPEELRWYVPAMGNYLRLIMGRNSLGETPLMKYSTISKLPKVNSNATDWGENKIKNGACTRYLFAGSNNFPTTNKVQVLWGMEGMSTSAWGEWSDNPWQVRCIRNLGTDLRKVSKGRKVTVAYKRRAGTNIMEMSYYDPASVRTIKLSGNGKETGQMPVHVSTNNNYNMAYKAFEFLAASDDISIDSDQCTLGNLPKYINGNPCSEKGEGWRVPNQFELAVMRNLGVFLPNNNNNYKYWISCTSLYFNSQTGEGSSEYQSEYQELFGVNKDKGIRIDENNIGWGLGSGGGHLYIRCVKDTE